MVPRGSYSVVNPEGFLAWWSGKLPHKEERDFLSRRLLPIIERCVEAAPHKPNPFVELDRGVVDVLCFEPDAACLERLRVCDNSVDQGATNAMSAICRRNVAVPEDGAAIPCLELQRCNTNEVCIDLGYNDSIEGWQGINVIGKVIIFAKGWRGGNSFERKRTITLHNLIETIGDEGCIERNEARAISGPT